jgi:hypothetical protein
MRLFVVRLPIGITFITLPVIISGGPVMHCPFLFRFYLYTLPCISCRGTPIPRHAILLICYHRFVGWRRSIATCDGDFAWRCLALFVVRCATVWSKRRCQILTIKIDIRDWLVLAKI